MASTETLQPADFIDWGQQENFKPQIGVGECAEVTIDLVATLFLEAHEKLELATETLLAGQSADSVYYSYSALIHFAKAYLTALGEKTNSHVQIIEAFEEKVVQAGQVDLKSFSEMAYRIKQNEPTEAFAKGYLEAAVQFGAEIKRIRELEILN